MSSLFIIRLIIILSYQEVMILISDFGKLVPARLNMAYPYRPNSAIIVVTHAACCIALAKSASGKIFREINSALPCGIYQLTRTHDANTF